MLSLTIDNRYQWVGLEGAPRTLTFSAHTPLRNRKIGLGVFLFSDRLGPLHNYGFMGIYAYKIELGKGMLSFGLQAGLKHIKIDWSKSTVKDEGDPIWINQPQTKPRPDADIGIYYSSKRFYAGISSKNLFENTFVSKDLDYEDFVYTTLARHIFVVSGYALTISDNFVLRPSVLLKYTANAPVNIDINGSVFIHNTLWLGLSYRSHNNALVFMAEIDLRNNFRIGYSYDTYLNVLKSTYQGSHEVMIGYDVNIFKPRILTPRYF
jgi:type IX secretion system PorP/SprF family membrane protein